MNVTMRRGRFLARVARTPTDLAAAQRLRHLCFVAGAGLPHRPDGRDRDAHDASCTHVLVEEVATGQAMGCFRLMLFTSGAGVDRSYAAQFYDLSRLSRFPAPLAEVGRFCIRPGQRDGDVLRVAWGAIAGIVDAAGLGMLFGCCSFAGTDPAPYGAAFAALGANHLAPAAWSPGLRAAEVVTFAPRQTSPQTSPQSSRHILPDRAAALRAMPPLLRSYIGLGGRVSDHAVIDRNLNTLHVLTGVEIATIPSARAHALRQVAGVSGLS